MEHGQLVESNVAGKSHFLADMNLSKTHVTRQSPLLTLLDLWIHGPSAAAEQ